VSDVDSAGNQGPCLAACSHAAQCGLFWRGATARWEISVFPGEFNGASFFAFMKSLRRNSIRTGRRVVVITDNAKYHHALLHRPWREEHKLDFSLDYLPPYSPDLNPIERVWKLTRRLCLHNRYFNQLEAVIDSVEAEFCQWTIHNETLRKLCAIT
jgi:transposase